MGEDTFNLAVLQDLFTMCKAREILPRREKGEKGKGKGKADTPPDRILLSYALNPFCSLQMANHAGILIPAAIRSIVLEATAEAGGEITASGPPPLKAERDVYSDHKKLSKQLG